MKEKDEETAKHIIVYACTHSFSTMKFLAAFQSKPIFASHIFRPRVEAQEELAKNNVVISVDGIT